jgi:hypothetical protein
MQTILDAPISRFNKNREFSINKPMFVSPPPAGRQITAGFSYMQRIGKSASVDVWFPDAIHKMAQEILDLGQIPGAEFFPAEWAAVRQFELLQEAGNYKIYDLDPTNLTRTLTDLTRSMRGGGYRVTVATLGYYDDGARRDELEILDRRLQKRIAHLINMLYLEEQSDAINAALDKKLTAGNWDYQKELPHIGVTLGARDLFKPIKTGAPLVGAARNHKLARQFFDILGLLPQSHILHDTAIGLQLPEAINEQEWIYIARDGEKVGNFVRLLDDLFAPFNKWSLAGLNEREGAGPEIKPMVGHMQGYGDRLRPEAENFYRQLAGLTAQ